MQETPPEDEKSKRPLTAAEAQNMPKPVRRRSGEAGRGSAVSDADWGKKEAGVGQMKFLILSCVLVLFVLGGAAFLVMKMRKKNEGQVRTFTSVEENYEPPELDISPESLDGSLPRTWFDRYSGDLPSRAQKIAQTLMNGSEAEKKAILRDPASLDLMSQRPSIFASEPILDRFDDWGISIETPKDNAFCIFRGKKENFSRFAYYYVRDGEELKLDWQATAAYSDLLFSELISKGPTGPTQVRAILKKSHYYVGPYKEAEWSSWELADPAGGEPLYAYVPRDSEMDKELLSWLDYGRFLLELKEKVKGTFIITPPKEGGRAKQVEISRVVTQDWVVFQ